jgi:hypothetical protein
MRIFTPRFARSSLKNLGDRRLDFSPRRVLAGSRSHFCPSSFHGCGNLRSSCRSRHYSLLCVVEPHGSRVTKNSGRSGQPLQLLSKLADSLFELPFLTSDCCQNVHGDLLFRVGGDSKYSIKCQTCSVFLSGGRRPPFILSLLEKLPLQEAGRRNR